mgnify:CR=1 FL=1
MVFLVQYRLGSLGGIMQDKMKKLLEQIGMSNQYLETASVEKIVVYDKTKKGFYVHQRHFDLNDIRLLAECVYACKSITETKAKRLVNVVCDFVSEEQARKIRHNAFLTDRVKTDNQSVLNNIAAINEAMKQADDANAAMMSKMTGGMGGFPF